jgi:prephenate dehydratase
MSIAYLGPQGSFSYICASGLSKLLAIGPLKAYDNITLAIKALDVAEADFALLPIENSLGGSVPEALDGFIKSDQKNYIQLEWVLPIEHALLGFGSLGQVKEVRGHFQAFAQCKNFLEQLPEAKQKEMTSNSASIASLRELSLTEKLNTAAIGPAPSGELYDVPLIQSKINDSSDNFTRFWLIGKTSKAILTNTQQLTSLAFRIPQDLPGGLLKVLSSLAARDINLSKIESRPTRGRLCEYTFFIDFVNPANWEEIKVQIMQEIAGSCSYLRVLGTYVVLPIGDLRFG